jgi:hypothetical protein
MEVGREEIERFLALMERSAVAQERLIELAVEERSISDAPGPPFCPSCGHFNPEVTAKAGGGPLGEFVLVSTCSACGKDIYAVPEGWQVFDHPEAALAYQEGRNTDEHS